MDEQQKSQMLPMGTSLQGGKYRVVCYMASGGFGNTYEVEHTELRKRMAMKEFFMRGVNQRQGTSVTVTQSENQTTFDQMLNKFYQEAQRLAKLEEAHIVGVMDSFKENDTAYYVMRLVEGSSLSARLAAQGHPFTEQQVRSVVLPQVLAALKYVHQHGLCHLDLKPGNIMQDDEGHCWLIDFGASKQMNTAESMTLSTSTGLCYTPGFAPVEQITGNTKDIGPWTDFYALGATLYNLLTDQMPPGSDVIINNGDKAFAFPASVSADMRSLIVWMMSPARKDRPQSVEEIGLRLPVVTEPAKGTGTSAATKLAQKPNLSAPTVMASKSQKSKGPLSKVMLSLAGVLTLLLIGGILLMLRPWDNSGDADVQEQVQESEIKPKEEEKASKTIDSQIVQGIIDNMVPIEGGTFQMGSADSDALSDEQPVHAVTLSPFSIGRYEVTQEEWETVMGTNPSVFTGSKKPVEQVSWDDCQEFISKLNDLTGRQFCLPTEAEWEYAARGGNKADAFRFAGSGNLDEVGWYDTNSGGTTHEVGQKSPNVLGLYDMSGNVWEWCQDWYGSYGDGQQTDPKGPGSASCRVYRGGGWGNNAAGCRVAHRNISTPSYQDGCLGFRLAAH